MRERRNRRFSFGVVVGEVRRESRTREETGSRVSGRIPSYPIEAMLQTSLEKVESEGDERIPIEEDLLVRRGELEP